MAGSEAPWTQYSPEILAQMGQRVADRRLKSDVNLRLVRSGRPPSAERPNENHCYYLHIAPETPIRPIEPSALNFFADTLFDKIPMKQHFGSRVRPEGLKVPFFYAAEHTNLGRRAILARVFPDAITADTAQSIREEWLRGFQRQFDTDDFWPQLLAEGFKKVFLRQDSRDYLMNGLIATDWVKNLESGRANPFSNLGQRLKEALRSNLP